MEGRGYNGVEDYEDLTEMEGYTLEQMFGVLYMEDTNNPTYCLAKGNVYDFLERDVRVQTHEALDVSRKLSQGEVEDAEEKAFALLEGESQ